MNNILIMRSRGKGQYVFNRTFDMDSDIGLYSPYLENAHLPLELCSLQILFYAVIIWNINPEWKKRVTALVYVAGIIGGLLSIFMAAIAPEYATVRDFFTSPRAWQFFLYHAMVVVVGLYAGFGKENNVCFSDIKGVIAALFLLDIISYLFIVRGSEYDKKTADVIG